MTLSLIVPVHKEQDPAKLAACLRSILAADPLPDEIVLVSDGTKVSINKLIKDTSRIDQLSTQKKLGPAHARNKGAAHASGDILVFIDSDIVVPKNLFHLIKDQFRAAPNLTALFGSYDNQPSEPNFLSQYRNLLHHFVHQTSNSKASTFWTGCGVIKRSVFMEMGGFDAGKYPLPSIEDIALGYRLTSADYNIRLCKKIQVKHLKKWNAVNMIKVDFFQRALPWSEIIINQKGLINDLNIKSKDRWSVTMVFLFGLSLLLIFFNPYLIIASILLTAIFLLLNYQLYQFFYREKGGWFTIRVIPWQGVFYFTSGLAFILAILKSLKKTSHE